MAKQLKLNIKNTQLAALLSKKKKTDVRKETPVEPDENIAKKPILKAKKITSLLEEKEKKLKNTNVVNASPQDDSQTVEPLEDKPDIALQESSKAYATISDSDDEILQKPQKSKESSKKPEDDIYDAMSEQEQKPKPIEVNDKDSLESKSVTPQLQEKKETFLKDPDTSSFLIRRGPTESKQIKTQETLTPGKKPSQEKTQEGTLASNTTKALDAQDSKSYDTKKPPAKKKLKEIGTTDVNLEEAEELRAIDTTFVKRPTFSRTVNLHNKTFEERKAEGYRRRSNYRAKKIRRVENTIYPTSITIRLPIALKELANELKRKANELIQPLFLEGFTFTQNDILDDESVVDFLEHKFLCKITIDRTKDNFIKVTDQTVEEEIQKTNDDLLELRAPVVAFMGHVDHGKTSLIDSIRKTDMVKGEAGAITQHIGAFRATTDHGPITILDTPGHEAFSNIRSRGAKVTDICVLVIAGDEGIKPQTKEAIDKTRQAQVPVIVAINKCDKPGFNADDVYRQLADQELLPEAWGGQTITVNCSAKTGEGIETLLELLALQAEILELKANKNTRARGTTLESNIIKGYGVTATILVQNGALNLGDALVFNHQYGRIKTMENEHGQKVSQALASYAIKVTGLSDAPEAGDEFIVVENEGVAKQIAQERLAIFKAQSLKNKSAGDIDELFKEQQNKTKKTLNVILKADTKSSLEALSSSIMNVSNEKVQIKIAHKDIGAVTENDALMAQAIDASIYAFHTTVDPRGKIACEKESIPFNCFDVIYHLIDAIKLEMTEMLDPIEERIFSGALEVLMTFKASGVGIIAGCKVTEGVIKSNTIIKVLRGKEEIIETKLHSLKHLKDEVKEVKKGFECGVVLANFKEFEVGDRLESFKIEYKKQTLDS